MADFHFTTDVRGPAWINVDLVRLVIEDTAEPDHWTLTIVRNLKDPTNGRIGLKCFDLTHWASHDFTGYLAKRTGGAVCGLGALVAF